MHKESTNNAQNQAVIRQNKVGQSMEGIETVYGRH